MTTETSVKQLPDGDAVFLSTETDTAWGHVGGMSILDPTGVPDFGYEKLVRAVEQRLVHVPRFRWKLLEIPFGLDRPYWVECTDFDVRKHVRHVLSPEPAMVEALLVDPADDARAARFARAYRALLARRFAADRAPFEALAAQARVADVYLGCSCPTRRQPDVRRCHTVLALQFLGERFPDLDVRLPER